MTFWKWSRTASSNSSADATIDWAEGMAPSTVNDSGRAMMAAAAKYRDDISGAIETGGTSTAYTVSSYQSFSALSTMDGKVIAFTPHTTSGATVTLNVDSLGAKPLRSAPSVELPAGVLVEGTPYLATYNNTDAVWYLHSFYGNPYIIPIGAFMPYGGSTAPNSSFVLPYGQAVSRTTYASLFSIFSTTYGAGDGSTTFNIPDMRGRVPVGKDDMGGVAASRITSGGSGLDGTSLGAADGEETHTLVTAEMPSHNHTLTDPGHTHSVSHNANYSTGTLVNRAGSETAPYVGGATISIVSSQTGITLASTGGGGAHNNVQPSIIMNYLLRVI